MMDLLAKYKESLRPILSFSSTLYVSADPLKARSFLVILRPQKMEEYFLVFAVLSFLVFFG